MTHKLSPQTRLINARAAYEMACNECPHWDYESDPDQGLDCCYALLEAKAALRKARKEAKNAN